MTFKRYGYWVFECLKFILMVIYLCMKVKFVWFSFISGRTKWAFQNLHLDFNSKIEILLSKQRHAHWQTTKYTKHTRSSNSWSDNNNNNSGSIKRLIDGKLNSRFSTLTKSHCTHIRFAFDKSNLCNETCVSRSIYYVVYVLGRYFSWVRFLFAFFGCSLSHTLTWAYRIQSKCLYTSFSRIFMASSQFQCSNYILQSNQAVEYVVYVLDWSNHHDYGSIV